MGAAARIGAASLALALVRLGEPGINLLSLLISQ